MAKAHISVLTKMNNSRGKLLIWYYFFNLSEKDESIFIIQESWNVNHIK